MKKNIACPVCNGRGFVHWVNSTEGTCSTGSKTCPHCDGTGVREVSMTNADRIRAMSDDTLAEFIILSPEMEFDVCRLCQFGNPTPMDDRGQCLFELDGCDAVSRAEAFKKWLKQPAEVE